MRCTALYGIFAVLLAVLPSIPDFSQQPATDRRTAFDEAQRALLAHDYSQAELGFRRYLQMDPRSAAGYSNLGVVYMRLGRYDDAIQALDKAKTLAPRLTQIDLNLGLAYYRQEEFASAIPFFRRVIAVKPTQSQARYLLGVCYFMDGDYPHAAATLQPLSGDEQGNPDFFFELGVAYGRLERSEESAQAFKQMLRAGGDTAPMHLLAGVAHLDLGQLPAAQSELEKATAIDPRLPFAHYNLGVVYRRQAKLGEAIREFEQEIKLSPDESWSYISLGTIDLQEGQVDQALDMFDHAVRISPRLPEALDGLGESLMKKGQPGKALPYFQRVVAVQPDSAKAHFQLGQAFDKLGRHEEAQKEIARAGQLQAAARQSFEETMAGKLRPPEAEP